MNNVIDFKKQIESDIREYQEKYSNYMKNINKDEWAFNFWVLDKFFYIDENEIDNYIIDYSDKGIDCYYFYEETKELYLIQNKYFSNSTLTGNYLNDDVFSRSINLLKSNTYTRSPELQKIYNENKNNSNFKVIIQIYVTNDIRDKSVAPAIDNFNSQNSASNISAEVYYLSDIYYRYYNEEPINHQAFDYTLKRINKETTLNINSDVLNSNIDSTYMIVSVIDIYEMVKESYNQNYNLVRNNIRDYMGKTTFNKYIAETLENEDERSNFLYYNNGITIICDEMSTGYLLDRGKYRLVNPQVVNGCQTVNTIYDTLSMIGDINEIKKRFSNCYVMTKILIIDNDNKRELYQNIVTYNNSQNAIRRTDFEAIKPRFLRLRSEYKKKGFLLCVRPSDKYQFSKEFKQPTILFSRAEKFLNQFGLNFTKTVDFTIPLDKFLQVILAYKTSSVQAVQKKSSLLKPESPLYQEVCEFILNDDSTNNDLLLLYLLYLRSEKEKKKSEDGRFPVAFFLIDGFSRFDCQGGKKSIDSVLNSAEKVNEIINLYTEVTKEYYNYFKELNDQNDYNTMIKTEINYDVFSKIYRDVKSKLEKEKVAN